jgi:regulator of protease activity HflC (stomatin/prohibitin superfamily)
MALFTFGLVLALILLLVAFFVLAFALAQHQLFFTYVREGTVMYVVRGPAKTGTFSHCLMAWHGHYLNDPRSSNFDPAYPPWEVLKCTNSSDSPSAYSPLSPWRLFERFGIYWYGFSPFYNIHEYVFKWSEPKMSLATNNYEAWRREELTQINFVSDFVYWAHLDAAEDRDNVPINVDYLLTTAVTNPYKARFGVTNWLTRLTADSNNAVKVWIGQSSFEQIVREVGDGVSATSGCVEKIKQINIDLPTDHREETGAPVALGVTIRASSLQNIAVAGRDQKAILEATTAKMVATKHAEATIATAEGEKQAAILRAEGNERAIELVYRKVQEFGQTGILLSQLDAMAKANAAGGTIIWANNPFIGSSGLADLLQRTNFTPQDLINLINRGPGAQGPQPAT